MVCCIALISAITSVIRSIEAIASALSCWIALTWSAICCVA
jgi:hypothetical protein